MRTAFAQVKPCFNRYNGSGPAGALTPVLRASTSKPDEGNCQP